MTLIKVTNYKDKKPIFINVETIGHIYQQVEKNHITEDTYTVIGTTTHNNGGFKVAEDIKKVLKLIEEKVASNQ